VKFYRTFKYNYRLLVNSSKQNYAKSTIE